jgi:hypothetical protein
MERKNAIARAKTALDWGTVIAVQRGDEVQGNNRTSTFSFGVGCISCDKIRQYERLDTLADFSDFVHSSGTVYKEPVGTLRLCSACQYVT